MKNIIKFFSVLAMGLFLASCAKEAPSKSEVEAGFDKVVGDLPTLAVNQIAAKDVDAIAGTADVTFTVSGLDTDLDSLSVGLLVCAEPTFANATFYKVENPTDGTFSFKTNVSPNSTWYFKAAAAGLVGAVYSETVSVDVPDIPFYYKVNNKSFAAEIVSIAYGDAYTHKITIIPNENDPENKCIIADIEPYYAANGATYAKAGVNYVEATIDNENSKIIVKTGADMHLTDSKTSRIFYGLNDAGSDFAATYAFTLAPDGSSLVSAGGFYTVSATDMSAEDAYTGGLYKKL